jgi:hypothetical protein
VVPDRRTLQSLREHCTPFFVQFIQEVIGMRNHSRRSQIIRWIGLVMLVAATGVLLLAAPFAAQS